ncbi:GNAT family N-acetyltransferase [Paenibacillus chitinolyticus]|uniref:GNAT family N-acetyltransferase n=1 Tax=Paenibacillus chitinolyticus TaxID=79263 RepID=UPI001C48A2CD|nr:GNAT family N-acetyltransferase [Paenibacillus chitinolyticus]MBV6712143.1 GNAT family N-acetyltransferase [Paenibacillus chitinolyticus]
MEIRKFQVSDIRPIVSLFYETVHFVNKKDYTQEQLHAWASQEEEELRLESWKDSMSRNITYVALIDGKMVGFSDMTVNGYVDRLYVDKDFQGQGVASALLNVLEYEAKNRGLAELEADASITAKPFFEHHGFQLVREQSVERRGIKLVNFKMKKELSRDV